MALTTLTLHIYSRCRRSGRLVRQFPQCAAEPRVDALGGIRRLMLLAVIIIIVDISIRRKQLDIISSVYFGMVVGMFLAYIVGLILRRCGSRS